MSQTKVPLIPPQSLAFNKARRLSDSIKIYGVPQSDAAQGLKYKVPDGAIPEYSIEVHCKSHTLYASDGTLEKVADAHPRPLMDVVPEGFFNTKSTYVDSESLERRTVIMRREQDDGLFSRQRTVEDFDGNRYKWKASLKGNLTCTRVADSVVVAEFAVRLAEWFRDNVGIFTLHVHVPEKTLHLLLSTCMVNYQMERRRRRSRYAGGGGGGGGGDGG